MTRAPRLIVLLLAVLLIAPVGLADREDGRDDRDDRDRPGEDKGREADRDEDTREAREERGHGDRDDDRREVKVAIDSQRALFELEKKTASSEEEIKLDYQADEGVLKLEFKQEADEAEASFEYKVELERLVEYVDDDGDGAYHPDRDTSVREYQVDEDMTWTVLGVEEIEADGVPGRQVTAEGRIDGTNGTMRIVFYAFGDFANLNGTSLRPTEVKFDLIYENFPWSHNASALAIQMKSEYESETEGYTNGTSLEAVAGDIRGYFEWADWALVDGVETPVWAMVLEDEYESETKDGESEVKREQKFYLSYARGDSIVHDPILGIATAGQEEYAAATPMVGVLAAAGAVATIAVLARRKE